MILSSTMGTAKTVPAMMYDSDRRYEMNLNHTRRCSRPSLSDDDFRFPEKSILNAVDRFIKSVNNMDSTILVPSRLKDMDVSNENYKFSPCVSEYISTTNVYNFYAMLKDLKNEILWGPTVASPAPSPSGSGRSSPNSTVMKNVRQTSDDSLGSPGFSSDQETDSDAETVVPYKYRVGETTSCPPGNCLASTFRHHLLGLHAILHELADSADYLTSRYQEEIETPSS